MTRHDWPRVERIYLAALEHDAARRQTFLDDACAGDEALRRDVESLLEHHDAAAVFLERPALLEVARQLAADRRSLVAEHRVGDFQIVSLIGVGGMELNDAEISLRIGRSGAVTGTPTLK